MNIKIEAKKWRDPEGNVYGAERSLRNGRYVVIRTNPGANRHRAKQFCTIGTAAFVQKVLDVYAVQNGWEAVET